MRLRPIDVAGWAGVAAIVAAYFLAAHNLLNPTDGRYLALNLIGSMLVMAEAFSKKDYQPVVLNLVWAGITIAAIMRILG